MKIIITSSPGTNETPLKINVDENNTLYDLIKLINKDRIAAKLQPVYQCSYNGVPLPSASLSTPLHKLLGKEEGEKTLHVSSEVPKSAQHNLSSQIAPQESVTPHVKSQPVKQASLSLFSAKQKSSYIADQKQILNKSLSFFPETLVNIISEYRGYEEVTLSNYDSYLVVNVAAMLPYPTLKNGTGQCILSAEFYTALGTFFGTVFDIGLHPNGHITIAMDTTKFQQFRFRGYNKKGDVIRENDQTNYFELELAKASIERPLIDITWGKGIISGYEVIIHLSPENNVRGIYAYPCNHNEFPAAIARAFNSMLPMFPHNLFSRELIHIDCSALEICGNRRSIQISDPISLATAFSCLMQKKIFGEDYVRAKHPEDEMDIKGIKVSEYHPYEKIALDYFLENHKASSDTKWDHTNTLDEIIVHALLSQNSWSHWAKGSQTKRTLLMLLGQDDAWFNKQTHESLKNAVLSHVQLQCAEIMKNNAHQPNKLSR